jgi:hypothetical protein
MKVNSASDAGRPEAGERVPSPWRKGRPRYRLRTLFVLMTVAAVVIGYWAARRRAALATIDRHNALVDQLIDNLATAPRGAAFIGQPQSKGILERFFGGKPSGEFPIPVQWIGGGLNFTAVSSVELDVSKLSAGAEAITNQIRAHYEQGLSGLGLQRVIDTWGNHEWTAAWSGQDNNLLVVIDVRIDEAAQTAFVRLLFADSQDWSLW